MRLHGNSLKQSTYFVIAHAITSAVVIFLQWESVTRRLSSEIWSILFGYGFISLALVVISSLFWNKILNKKQLMLLAAVVPYLAASSAYAVVLYFWATNRPVSHSGSDIAGFLGVTLFFPYLAIWGPLISVGNLLLVWLMIRPGRK